MAIRTDNVSVQTLLAQAQAKSTSSSKNKDGSTDKTSEKNETSTAEKIKQLAPSLSKVHERIAAQAQAASTSLSALGQFKSSLVDLGTSGKELVALSATSTTQSVQSAVEKFVAKYNASVSKGAGNGSDIGVSRSLRELRSALSGGGAVSPSLSRLGITQNANGTLSLDTKALAKSMGSDAAGVTAAFSRIGKSVEASADSALGSDSRLSNSIASLGNRAAALQKQESAVVSTATRLGDVYGSSASFNRMVLDAYLKN
jgi:hypothetical protein